ncbi:capbinding protein [Rhodotorula toruloides]|uniref:Capbinding protein n=1 Tax=Rhodotorula toruloides TaxID=5286 RepID=A0A511KQU5_RHOTO|nr:capbinding protein [Rhodotorula toruloides]
MSATDSTAPAPSSSHSNLPAHAAAAAHSAVSTASSNPDLTVLSSPIDFTVKHPLCSPWTLWFDSATKQDKAKSWDEALTNVISFQSIEEFWGLYNNIVPPSLLGANSNYYLFKQGIKPAWEDEANARGGKWSVQLPRGKYTDQVDTFWLYTMLAAIGETFETPFVPPAAPSAPAAPPSSSSDAPPSDSASPASPPAQPTPVLPPSSQSEITGVIVSARKAFYRINIWTRSSSPSTREKIENVGKQFKYHVLGFEYGGKVGFGDKDKVSSDVEFVSHKDSQNKGNKNRWTV